MTCCFSPLLDGLGGQESSEEKPPADSPSWAVSGLGKVQGELMAAPSLPSATLCLIPKPWHCLAWESSWRLCLATPFPSQIHPEGERSSHSCYLPLSPARQYLDWRRTQGFSLVLYLIYSQRQGAELRKLHPAIPQTLVLGRCKASFPSISCFSGLGKVEQALLPSPSQVTRSLQFLADAKSRGEGAVAG